MVNIIKKLKDSNLVGRGGANFPTWQKWQAVKDAQSTPKYIVCNASEGEPLVFKDKYLLENYPQEVINGLKIALKTIRHSQAYIYLNKDYFQLFKKPLENLIAKLPIKLFEKPFSYIAGEETSLLNAIEGKKPEPRIKPPYPTQVGLFGKPTLINNVETFYWVSKIDQGKYEGNRFYSIEGETKNKGVFELPETKTIEQILQETNNWPDFDFFCQVGGGACGTIMLSSELNQPIKGTGSIIIFDKNKTDVYQLMRSWAEFLHQNNCDQCAPCREGLYRIFELMSQDKEKVLPEKTKLNDIFTALEKTSFCPLGRLATMPFKSAIAKLI
ncbi:MAG: hypothetical protein NTZ42_01885 [Candidatus Gribaldobacteria bacterium]|nr:hypothetical protein [Candidatus Gribaldobacteria bacterium]